MDIHLLLILVLLVGRCSSFRGGGIYKLPELVVHTNTTYLMRGTATQLECRVNLNHEEWAKTVLDRIYWMKDGTPISELSEEHNELMEKNGVLHVVKATHFAEGEYQCSAIVRNIQLAPDTVVDSRLVSAPVKLRRARITKFERYASEKVKVKAGEVARLPCLGLPDVVPGPPEIWFEKQGHEGVQLGRTGNQRFISTPSGLQIALTQPVDAGRYYCMVRNAYMNFTRAAPKPIDLHVEPSPRYRRPDQSRKPKVVYPTSNNYSEPVEYHVVAGQTAILECVMADAVIRWNKPDFSMADVSIDDDRARIRQIWGNLRIKHVTVDDSDDYVCHGLKAHDDTELRAGNHPTVTYRLVVHAPTNVRLMLAQQVRDKAWQLSCYAHNLWYEIPMVYVNGLALIDAMDEMGVPPQTNFYTNPINVTLRANNPLSGSIQCVSRPAMEEAEIYGPGLERGRSMNLYVDKRLNARPNLIVQGPTNATRSLGTRVQLICVPLGVNDLRIRWLKDGKTLDVAGNRRLRVVGTASLEIVGVTDEDSGRYTCEVSDSTGAHQSRQSAYLTVALQGTAPKPIPPPANPNEDTTDFVAFEVAKPVIFMDADKNARVQWSVKASHEKHAYLREFVVELRQRDPLTANSSSLWTEADRVPAHVRATTLKKLNGSRQFQFRVSAMFTGGFSQIYSPPTDWLGFVQPKMVVPLSPRITRVQTISHESILVVWEHVTGTKFNVPDKFIITYMDTSTADEQEIRVSNTTSELLIDELEAGAEYRITIYAENSAGRSYSSRPRIARTYVLVDEENAWRIMGLHGGTFLLFLALLILLCPILCALAFAIVRRYNYSRDSRRIRRDTDPATPTLDIFLDKGHGYEGQFFGHNDPLSELAPLNYAVSPEEEGGVYEEQEMYAEKNFANIRSGTMRSNIVHASQLSLHHPMQSAFKSIARRPNMGLYSTANGMSMPGIACRTGSHYRNLSPTDPQSHRKSRTANLSRGRSALDGVRSPSTTRSALSVFTGADGKAQVQRRHLPSMSTSQHSFAPHAYQNHNVNTETSQPNSTNTSPNASAGSPSTQMTASTLLGVEQDSRGPSTANSPPLNGCATFGRSVVPAGTLRGALSTMELSSFKTSSPLKMFGTTVGDDSSDLPPAPPPLQRHYTDRDNALSRSHFNGFLS